MQKKNDLFDKEIIQEAFKQAVDKVTNEDEEIDNPSLIDAPTDEVVSIDVEEKVNEKVENEVEEDSNFDFLGISISITKNKEDENYSIKLEKDDLSKEDIIEDISLPSIFNSIDNFFTELTLNDEEEIDENKESDTEKETNLDEEIENVLGGKTLSSIKTAYNDKLNSIFEHGLKAKEIALDMVKKSVLSDNVKELIKKSKEKDSLIASRKEILNNTTKKYILAKKMNTQLNIFNNAILSNITAIKNDLQKGLISKTIAEKAIDNCYTIISKIEKSNKPETIIAGISALEKNSKAILAYEKKISNKKVLANTKIANKFIKDISETPKLRSKGLTANKKHNKLKVNYNEDFNDLNFNFDDDIINSPKIINKHKKSSIKANKISHLNKRLNSHNFSNEIKPVFASNSLNSDGMGMSSARKTLSASKRFNEIDEMTAEITRIAGI